MCVAFAPPCYRFCLFGFVLCRVVLSGGEQQLPVDKKSKIAQAPAGERNNRAIQCDNSYSS